MLTLFLLFFGWFTAFVGVALVGIRAVRGEREETAALHLALSVLLLAQQENHDVRTVRSRDDL